MQHKRPAVRSRATGYQGWLEVADRETEAFRWAAMEDQDQPQESGHSETPTSHKSLAEQSPNLLCFGQPAEHRTRCPPTRNLLRCQGQLVAAMSPTQRMHKCHHRHELLILVSDQTLEEHLFQKGVQSKVHRLWRLMAHRIVVAQLIERGPKVVVVPFRCVGSKRPPSSLAEPWRTRARCSHCFPFHSSLHLECRLLPLLGIPPRSGRTPDWWRRHLRGQSNPSIFLARQSCLHCCGTTGC